MLSSRWPAAAIRRMDISRARLFVTMRPRLFTVRNIILALLAVGIGAALIYWVSIGAPLPGGGVPSTAGKLVFVSDRDGHKRLWMANATDGADAVALTSGTATDSAPAWRKDGGEIAFVSENRAGVTPQLFDVDAKPGTNPIALSNTSSTKADPQYGPDGRVYYLAAGKVIATDPASRDTDLLFPTADAAKTAAPLLSTGGIVAEQPSPNGKRLALALQMEKGQALLLYDIDSQQCALLGAAADRVLFRFLADGRLFALFCGGTPVPKPLLLFSQDQVKASLPGVGPLQLAGESEDQITLQVGDSNDPHVSPRIPMARVNLALVFAADGTVSKSPAPMPVPFEPNSLALSPDGSRVVFAVDTPSVVPQGELPPGLFAMPIGGTPAPGSKPILFTEACYNPSFSPDGKQIVFASGKDIYRTPADGSTPAANLTKGQGMNGRPAWSPAVAETK